MATVTATLDTASPQTITATEYVGWLGYGRQ